MTEVKICGNQTLNDVSLASGADALGFILATPESKREISPEKAAELINRVPPFTSTVMVTTESNPHVLEELVATVKPDYLQLHSNASRKRIEKVDETISDRTDLISVLAVGSSGDKLTDRARSLSNSPAVALLLDSKVNGRSGGTGRVHDWDLSRKIKDAISPFPVILAGGLDPENVSRAIKKVRPHGVDVATGVEDNGTRSGEKIKGFLNEVNNLEA